MGDEPAPASVLGESHPSHADGARRRAFLTARWVNLGILTYAIEPRQLLHCLPPGCELDVRDGSAFVSLVAFDFSDTRVLGRRWPGHVNFPEINLRFYVRHEGRRGVCFIREFVPRRMIAILARLFYNEPYRAAVMTSKTMQAGDSLAIEHELNDRGARGTLRVRGRKPAKLAGAETIEHFFKEHDWGFGRTRRGKLLEYRVSHPAWETLAEPVAELNWPWGQLYGPRWEFLAGQEPMSVILALGSAVSVFPRG